MHHGHTELSCPSLDGPFGCMTNVKTMETLGHLTSLHLNQVLTGRQKKSHNNIMLP